jgi:hypothetical protein
VGRVGPSQSYNFSYGGNGGAGIASSISGSAIQYAGGGGGGVYTNGVNGLGSAGGGNGALRLTSTGALIFPQSGLVNTGGGGGGSGGLDNVLSGAGGSGIVIIRYPSYQVAATSTTGGPEMYIAGAWRVYKFVASGTITF